MTSTDEILQCEKQLERCPFCGEKAEMFANGHMKWANGKTEGYVYDVFGVRCTGCDVTTGLFSLSPEYAVKFWNTRKEKQKPVKTAKTELKKAVTKKETQEQVALFLE